MRSMDSEAEVEHDSLGYWPRAIKADLYTHCFDYYFTDLMYICEIAPI